MVYRFKKWKPSIHFKPGSVGIMIGKKGTGKSTALADIAYHLRAHPEVTLFQKTYRTNNLFHGIVPGMFCYDDWEPAVIKEIIKRQTRLNAKRLKEKKPPVYHTIIVDDLAFSKAFTKDNQLEELILNARWLKLNIIFTLQDALKIPPALRSNADWILILKELNSTARKRLYEHYCGQFESPKEFYRVLDKTTNDRQILVFNTTGLSNNISDNYFVWTATPRNFNDDPSIPEWKMGSKKYWAFHYRYYNNKWDQTEDENSFASNSDEVVIM
jgi:hypothetical protein